MLEPIVDTQKSPRSQDQQGQEKAHMCMIPQSIQFGHESQLDVTGTCYGLPLSQHMNLDHTSKNLVERG